MVPVLYKFWKTTGLIISNFPSSKRILYANPSPRERRIRDFQEVSGLIRTFLRKKNKQTNLIPKSKSHPEELGSFSTGKESCRSQLSITGQRVRSLPHGYLTFRLQRLACRWLTVWERMRWLGSGNEPSTPLSIYSLLAQ